MMNAISANLSSMRKGRAMALLGAAVGVAATGLLLFRRSPGERAREAGIGSAVRSDEGLIRSAGPDGMRTPPERWSKTDQAIDESFPASDPPGHSPPPR